MLNPVTQKKENPKLRTGLLLFKYFPASSIYIRLEIASNIFTQLLMLKCASVPNRIFELNDTVSSASFLLHRVDKLLLPRSL